MDPGDTTTFEAWVLRDCVWQIFSSGFETADDALQRPLRHGYTPERIQVVSVRRVRTIVLPKQEGPTS